MSKPALWMTSRPSPTNSRNGSATRGEDRLVGEEGLGEAVDVECALRHRALRVDVGVEGAPGRELVDELDAADLDDAVARGRIGAGGLGVEDDLAHASASGPGRPGEHAARPPGKGTQDIADLALGGSKAAAGVHKEMRLFPLFRVRHLLRGDRRELLLRHARRGRGRARAAPPGSR